MADPYPLEFCVSLSNFAAQQKYPSLIDADLPIKYNWLRMMRTYLGKLPTALEL